MMVAAISRIIGEKILVQFMGIQRGRPLVHSCSNVEGNYIWPSENGTTPIWSHPLSGHILILS